MKGQSILGIVFIVAVAIFVAGYWFVISRKRNRTRLMDGRSANPRPSDWVVYALILLVGVSGVFLRGDYPLPGYILVGFALIGLLAWLAFVRRRRGIDSSKRAPGTKGAP